MNYSSKEIKKGIKVHFINTDLFKTNLIAVFLTEKLSKENVTMNAVIPAVLKRGTEKMDTQEKINKSLEELYGAEFNSGVDKTGDNHVLKFYIETLSNEYIITDENLLKESIEKILEMVFNPYLENGVFKNDYVEEEKEKIRVLIESKIDNKDKYAIERCTEELYKDMPYGLYKLGNKEDIQNINSQGLYKRYMDLINTAKIDIFISGNFEQNEVEQIINQNGFISKLPERDANYIVNNETTEVKEKCEEKNIKETLDVEQGKLVVALDILENSENSRYSVSIYNVILGGSPNSKMFQNVREKEGLCYSIGSTYLRPKGNIFIKAGIQIENYDKTLELMKKQIEDMKNGDFTNEDMDKAKKFMVYAIKSIEEDQEVGLTYYLGQELSRSNVSPKEYLERINKVSKEDVINIANKVRGNTVYFLTKK